MKTIIAAFSDQATADRAIAFLRSRGVEDVQLISSAAATDTNYLGTLSGFDVPDNKAEAYAEIIRRGAPVIAARTDHDARELAHELDRMGSLDIDKAHKRWTETGWSGYDRDAAAFDADAYATERAELLRESGLERERMEAEGAGARDLEVVEERVAVGTREVPRGGVRVRTFVSERPVREEVQLTEERIDVQRERVDEPASPGALDMAKEEEFVVTARGEEAVVGKEARVVERVHVGKTAETRTEQIEETERRRDVEVKPIEDTNIGKPGERRR
jgi:stress response protein YsnF